MTRFTPALALLVGLVIGYAAGARRHGADLAAIDAALAASRSAVAACRAGGAAVALGDSLASCREANASCAAAVAEVARNADGCRAFLRLTVED